MSFHKELVYLVFVAVVGFPELATGQKLRELARHQAIQNPGVPLQLPSPPADYVPKPIEEVAKEAEVVLEGRLSKPKSYLGPAEDHILTDYQILEPKVIAGSLGSLPTRLPGPGVPLILTVLGGEVVVEGVPIRGTDTNREAIKDGERYLLFLKQSRRGGSGRYEIHHGGIFEILHEDVKPLLKGADNVFKGTVDRRLNDIVSRIQGAVRRR